MSTVKTTRIQLEMSGTELARAQQYVPIESPDLAHIDRIQFCRQFGSILIIAGVKEDGPRLLARIVGFSPKIGQGDLLYEADVSGGIPLDNLRRVPVEFGFASVACVGPAESMRLILSLVAPKHSKLLSTADGRSFRELPNPAETAGIARPLSLLYAVGGVLYAAPVGTIAGSASMAAGQVLVLASEDSGESWKPLHQPGFGDKTNRVVQALCAYHGQLCAAVGNPEHGFQLWVAPLSTDEEAQWKLVIPDGAYRYTENSCVSALCVFDGKLYLGAGGLGPGFNQGQDPVLASAELLEIREENGVWAWSLVCGSPRFTPDDLKIPIATGDAGFSLARKSVFSHFVVHGGSLYATVNVQPSSGGQGSYSIWRSPDGVNWSAVTEDGFHRGIAWLRCLESDPSGLIGIAQRVGLQPGARSEVFLLANA